MPERRVIKRAQKAKRQGKSAATQAGEFVRREIEKIRSGRHGVRSARQAIAIGLSEARRAGVRLLPKRGKKAVRTKGPIKLRRAARKAAHTREVHAR